MFIHRCEVDDINFGLEHFFGQFDVVHTRLLSSGVCFEECHGYALAYPSWVQIKDYHGLVNHIAQVLKPGGIIDLMEYDFTLHDADRNLIEIDTSTIAAPWWPRWMAFVRQAAMNRGADIGAASKMRRWVEEHGAFYDLTYRQVWIPASPWHQGDDDMSKWWRSVGEVQRTDIFVCFSPYCGAGLVC